MANYLSNAFSLQMISTVPSAVTIEEIASSDIPEDVVSCIGHPDTAACVASILEREVPCNRVNVSLSEGDVLYVAQLMGGRLPEGATTLPEGFTLKFLRVKVTYSVCATNGQICKGITSCYVNCPYNC